jgi:hypothetical protein
MRHPTPFRSAAALAAILVLSLAARAAARGPAGDFEDAWSARYRAEPSQRGHAEHGHDRRHGDDRTEWLRHWNRVAVDASGLDHTPVPAGDPRVFGEQFGPARASRAMAIVHIAVFEAVNAIAGGYHGYLGIHRVFGDVSMRAAISQAAHDTLIAMFPSQTAAMDDHLADDMDVLGGSRRVRDGRALGARCARAILALRSNDGSAHAEPQLGVDFLTSDEPGMWRQDPISQLPIALGARWNEVTPFTMRSADQFRAPEPPALTSPEYAAAFAETKRLGGDGITTPTERTPEQTEIGTYWAYDGTPSLCAPPRLYNQIAMHIADQMGSGVVEQARLLALLNVALADAGIAVWESKYHYQYWRPVTGIREADPGTGPTGLGDGNPATTGDPTFSPLGAPASNLQGPNFTPPFPSYPSGHAGFGGALFQTLRRFYRTDRIPFTFVSDEFNGTTVDNQGNVRPLVPRSFRSLSQAEDENGQSRIYLGIHWRFDKTEGIAEGRRVANWVFDRTFLPIRADP